MSSNATVERSRLDDAAVVRALLARLQALSPGEFPGVDGMTADDALHCYRMLAARHRVPDREELLRDHPEWAEPLNALFGVADCG